MNKWRIAGFVCLLLVAFVLGTRTGIWMDKRNTQAVMVPQDSVSEFQLIDQAWNITRDNYVDKNATQPKSLAYGSIDGMINSLWIPAAALFLPLGN